jgi:hypothetical protein
MVIKLKMLRIADLLSASVRDKYEEATLPTPPITGLNKFNINHRLRTKIKCYKSGMKDGTSKINNKKKNNYVSVCSVCLI